MFLSVWYEFIEVACLYNTNTHIIYLDHACLFNINMLIYWFHWPVCILLMGSALIQNYVWHWIWSVLLVKVRTIAISYRWDLRNKLVYRWRYMEKPCFRLSMVITYPGLNSSGFPFEQNANVKPRNRPRVLASSALQWLGPYLFRPTQNSRKYISNRCIE
jgi:hypothetical protein